MIMYTSEKDQRRKSQSYNNSGMIFAAASHCHDREKNSDRKIIIN